MATVELAYNAENKEFMAPCCLSEMGHKTILWRNYTERIIMGIV